MRGRSNPPPFYPSQVLAMKPNLPTPCARVLLILLAAAGSLFAAPPVNDSFANRINLGNTFPTSATGTNVEATEQTGEPLPISGLSTVWWRWTAPAAGQVEVNTAGSVIGADPLDTVLAVYTGTVLTSLVRVALNDESAVGFTSLVRFTAVAGTTYIVQVLGYEGAAGIIKLNVKTGPSPPVNDALASAVTLTTGTAASGTTDGSTLQASEVVPAGIAAADYYGSSWWAWTAPSAGWFHVRVTGAGYDQVASIWTGTAVNALTAVHAVVGDFDVSGVSKTADLYFLAIAGTRYPIAVGNLYSAEGVPVSLTVSSAPVPAVYNASLTVSPGAVNVTSAPATVNAVFRMVSAQPITEGFVNLSRASGFFKSVAFAAAQRTSGTSTDGTYAVPFCFPATSSRGLTASAVSPARERTFQRRSENWPQLLLPQGPRGRSTSPIPVPWMRQSLPLPASALRRPRSMSPAGLKPLRLRSKFPMPCQGFPRALYRLQKFSPEARNSCQRPASAAPSARPAPPKMEPMP